MKKNFFLTLMLALVALFSIETATAQAPAATPTEAITGLLNRIGGDGAADRFEIVIDANLAENGKDVFVIAPGNSKPCIKGNTQLSVATGINWYLNHYAHINLTWNNLTTDLSQVTLPVPGSEEKHVCNTTYRYDFNTCTFSYSMAFWTWERWQQEIDWMALHGINAPLNLVGLDVVTRKFLRELGVSESDINAYIAGPGFIAWFAMNNLEGWGGTINSSSTGVQMNGNPDWWYTRQEQLCRNMLQRMRELGMQPVIPGFSGQIPNSLSNYTISGFSSSDVINGGTWAGGYTRPDILHPNSSSYATLAPIYYKHLEAVMGVSEFYSMDPFHEGGLPGSVTNATCYPPIMAALDTYHNAVDDATKTSYNVGADDNQAKWIIQYWQNIPQSGAFSAMSSYGDRFIGLDLFSDNIYAGNAAKWRDTGNACYYQGRPYIYCMLHNFGGRSGLHGRLETTMDGYFQALAKGNNCQGIGATPEGIETNPILYDMLFELPWMSANPGADNWLKEYAYSRYGINPNEGANVNALEALKNLKKSVWNCQSNQQGTSEAVILARPNWTIGSVSSWSTSAIYWDTQDVLLAADQLYSVKDLVTANGGEDGVANYNYDFIDVVRQAMVDYAAQLLPLINAARGNNTEYTRLYQLYLQLMLDLDEMLSYDENFKLERWTSLARNIANEVDGTTENDRNWLEWNARTQITVWSNGNTDLHDYSNRCWAGLIKDFHYKRWEKFFTTNGGSFSGGWYSGFEYPWTVDFNETYNLAGDYSKVVIPNDMTATEKAAQTFGNYFGRVKGATKNYIFPMGVTTNATNTDVIPEVYRGKEVELPLIIGKNVTITEVKIDLNGDSSFGNGETLIANGNKVTIPADAKIGVTTAQVTYSDGTVIKFRIALIEDITDARTVTAVAGANGSVAIEGTNELSITTTDAVKITATANTGYNFKEWTDAQGNVVGNDNPFIYYGKDAATFTANFIQDKWGVVACSGTFSGDIAGYAQFIHNLTFAYYNREAETIFETTTAPTEIFNTIPQIVNVPQGASFDVKYDNGNSDGLKYCYFRAFIDLNQDGDFDDEGELLKTVGTDGAANTAVCSNKINVLLPYDMPLGITHMRLRFDGAWDNGNKPSGRGAKDASIRPVYEIIINVTEGSDKAAHIEVETNSADWGTVECWTDETPGWTASTEWDVSANIPMHIKAIPASADVEFVGWYDQYGRLLTTDLEYSRLAIENAVYTARFRKFLEIDGWQIEYRTQPGSDVVTTKLANGVKPVAGKKYYIYAPTRPTNDGEYVNRYLYNNSGTLTLSTTESTAASYLWLCSVDGENYTFQNVGDPTKYLKHKGIQDSPFNFKLGTGDTKYEGITLYSSSFFVIKDDGTGFDQSSRTHNQSTEDYCTDFVFTEVSTPDVVILTNIRKSGDHDLEIPETVEILGEQCKIVGFDNNLFKDNKDLWSISLPATIEEMSNNKVFTGAVKGKGANASASADNYITTELGTTLAAGEDWSISLTIEDNGSNFNQWGSALIATGNAPMNSTYANGFQLYLQAGGGLVVKTDVDSDAKKLTNLTKGTKFRIDVVYTHSNTTLKVTATPLTSASASAARAGVARAAAASLEVVQDMSDFGVVSHAIPEGVNITNLEVSKGATPDPFEGCTNLLDVTVDAANENYIVEGRTLKSTGGTTLHTLADEEKEEEIRALGELIDLAEALIAEVATNINPTGKATAIGLQANDPNAAFYVSTNADQNTGGGNTDGAGIAGLVDNNNDTYFHSRWGGTDVNATHHIEVDLGEGNRLSEFKFSYVSANGPDPTKIVVKGSNNGEQFDQIGDIIIKNAINSGATYGSDIIESEQSYRYLRFEVAESERWGSNANPQGEYCFSMKEFDIYDLTSTAEVKNTYKNLAGVTAEEVEGVYDSMTEALYYYNNSGTAEELAAAYTALEPLYTALKAKKDKVFNGVYKLVLKKDSEGNEYDNSQVSIAYNTTNDFDWICNPNQDPAKYQGYKMVVTEAVENADSYFTITENGVSYSFQAQGMYLKQQQDDVAVEQWKHTLFSNNEDEAGAYLFEETEDGIFKIKGLVGNIPYLNVYSSGNELIIGNNGADAFSTFSFVPVPEYTLTVPANGVTTLCLPFNVVLPAGVTAYDLAKANIIKGEYYNKYELVPVAGEGDVLAKNTPVIIKAAANDYTLTITMNDEGAKASVENSVLRSGIVKTTLGEGNNYTFDGVDFNLVAAGTEIAANQCWMELDENLGAKIYGTAPDYVLTTDEENPVLYKIQVNRNFNNPTATVLGYNESTGVVNVVASADNNSYQAWYFMEGDNGGILIKPYNGDGKVLGADNNNDGGTKVWAVEKDSKAIDEWTFEKNDGWYNILGDGKCFSNHGGQNSGTMGFYNVKNDGGSQFKFVEAEFTNDNARYYQLKDVAATMDAATYYSGTSVGLYSTESVNAYNAIFTTANDLLTAGSDVSASADCHAAYKALRTADEVLVYNAPADDKVYYIISTASNSYCAGKYVHTNRTPVEKTVGGQTNTYDQRHLSFAAAGEIDQLSLAAFQFVATGTQGEYKMKNLHTGLYVKSFASDADHMGAEGDAAVVRILAIADDQVALQIGNNDPMHAQDNYSAIVQWGASANNASTWSINEVADMSELYTLAVPESGVATLNLAFNVQLPEGVTAYDFVESDIDEGEFTLTQVAAAGDVLAKNTPVIIKAAAGDYDLTVTMSDENVKNGTANSVLCGNYWQTTVGIEHNYLPGIEEEKLVFAYATEDNKTAPANTVWASLTAKKSDKLFERKETYVTVVTPTLGKVYRIKNYTKHAAAEYQYHYIANSNASIVFPTSVEDDDNSAMWVCTSADTENHKYKFVSALGTAAFGWQGAAEEALEYTISEGTIDGTVTLADGTTSLALTTEAWNNRGKAAFNQASNGGKVQSEDSWSTDWYLEEIDDADVSFTASINKGNEWATMYLPYAVAIPDGVDVFYAVEDAIEGKYINLTLIEGTIPARTAVLLRRAGDAPSTEATARFKFDLAEDVEAVASNLFDGTIMQTAIDASGAKVYLLINYNKEAFYWMADEYNANCELTGADAGYVKNDANRAYLKLLQGASSYSFRFDGTTGIEDVKTENGEVKAIYDLQGRKLTEITKPGIYIVDGEKVLVK